VAFWYIFPFWYLRLSQEKSGNPGEQRKKLNGGNFSTCCAPIFFEASPVKVVGPFAHPTEPTEPGLPDGLFAHQISHFGVFWRALE
jgi:hypothetical protein